MHPWHYRISSQVDKKNSISEREKLSIFKFKLLGESLAINIKIPVSLFLYNKKVRCRKILKDKLINKYEMTRYNIFIQKFLITKKKVFYILLPCPVKCSVYFINYYH